MAGDSKPRVSVIVPTLNRKDLLDELIDSLWNQTLPVHQYEIVVIDDGSTDGTADRLAQRAAASPCRLVWRRLDENTGVAHATNVGVTLAEGDILAFTDSDCRVSTDWLERGLAFFADEEVSFVSGALRDKPGQPVTFFSLRNGATPGENFAYPTCNVFYRKRVFSELNGLDERLSLGNFGNSPVACADTDLAWRAKEAGHRNVYSEELVVYHEVRTVSPWEWLLAHGRLIIVPRLAKRHPGLREKCFWWGPFVLAANPLFYCAFVGTGLAVAVHPIFGVMAFPFLYHSAVVPGRRWSLSRIPRTVARVAFLSLLQAFICGCLIYGSLRARTLVL